VPDALLTDLAGRIDKRTAVIGVVGLGYVGTPVAAVVADSGFEVIGVDTNQERVGHLQAGRNPLGGEEPGLDDLVRRVVSGGRLRTTTQHAELAEADVILICVDTPVGPDHRPQYQSLKAACKSLAPHLKAGALVIVESTTSPGTVHGVVRPILEAGAKPGWRLGNCPERVMPGRLLLQLRTMLRVIGAETPEVAEVMAGFYRAFVDADLDLTDSLTAELVKTAENAYRDVNIAFANELALICELAGGDVWKVRDLVNKAPTRHVLVPGAGVGGHCIPKDSWLLAAPLGEDMNSSLLATTRHLNDSMPSHMADLVLAALAEASISPEGARVAVLGYAYLQDSDDTRNSPTAALLPILESAGCKPAVHDPFVAAYQGDLMATLAGTDCAVVMVAHSEYGKLDLRAAAAAMRHAVLVDGRNVFSPAALEAAGFRHRRVGTAARNGRPAYPGAN
jgi:UDP-N-acetyl-D-mannosaminuronic acid dehydrogenase